MNATIRFGGQVYTLTTNHNASVPVVLVAGGQVYGPTETVNPSEYAAVVDLAGFFGPDVIKAPEDTTAVGFVRWVLDHVESRDVDDPDHLADKFTECR